MIFTLYVALAKEQYTAVNHMYSFWHSFSFILQKYHVHA